MKAAKEYKTKQRSLILEYLKANSNKCILIDDIYRDLLLQNKRIGKTTVYRTLTKLLNEGKAMKFTNENGEGALFKYRDEECRQQNHIHLKCLSCDKIIHLDCSFIDDLKTHLAEDHEFQLDESKTVIYGYCKTCAKE